MRKTYKLDDIRSVTIDRQNLTLSFRRGKISLLLLNSRLKVLWIENEELLALPFPLIVSGDPPNYPIFFLSPGWSFENEYARTHIEDSIWVEALDGIEHLCFPYV